MHSKPSSSLLASAIVQSVALALAFMAAPVGATTGAAGTPPVDFRLPPAPTPTATPQVQGPVDIEGPVPVRPRVIPTERPAAVPTPAATQRPPPTIQQPAPAVSRTPETRRFTPAARAVSGQRALGEDTVSGEGISASPPELTPAEQVLESLPLPTSLPTLAEADGNPLPQGAADKNGWMSGWPMWLALAAGLIGLLYGSYQFRSRRQLAPAGTAPIEPPLARRPPPSQPDPKPVSAPVPAPVPAKPPVTAKSAAAISLTVTPAKLSRSMMNATLSCAISVHNRSGNALENLRISGDLVTAHGKVPIDEQLANGSTKLALLNPMPALPAGETGEVTASLILPISQIRTIAQGRATLYVPLLRLRVEGEGVEPVTQTFVIGMKPPGSAKVQPFRLDEMPQTYSQIGSRALD